MSDLTLRMIGAAIADIDPVLDEAGKEVQQLADAHAAAERRRADLDAQRTGLMRDRALLAGEATEFAPGDVRSSDDVMGLHVGRLIIAPPGEATDADLAAYAETMLTLVDQARHQAMLATSNLAERRARGQTPADGVLVATGPRDTEAMAPVPSVDPNPARALPVIAPAEIEAPPLADSGDCVHCKGRVTRTPSGLVHDATIRAVCYVDRPDSPYAELADPFAVGPDPEETDQPAPQQLHAYRVTFHKLGRQKNITPLELQASSIEQLERLIAIDAARTLGTFAEQITIEDDWRDEDDDDNVARGCVLRNGKKVGQFTVEQIDDVLRDAQPRPSADLVPPAHNEEATEQ